MAADALAPYVARTSSSMILTMSNRQVLVWFEEGFQLPVSYHCGDMTQNVNICLCSLLRNLARKGLILKWLPTLQWLRNSHYNLICISAVNFIYRAHNIHRGPVNSPYKWPITLKMFPFDDVIMEHAVSNMSTVLCQSQLLSHFQLITALTGTDGFIMVTIDSVR